MHIEQPKIEWGELTRLEQISTGKYFVHRSAVWNGILVVVKLVREDISEEESALASRDLENELHMLSILKHENIVTLYGSGKVGGRRYLVLEFLEGGTLATLISAFRQQYKNDAKYLSDSPKVSSNKHVLFKRFKRKFTSNSFNFSCSPSLFSPTDARTPATTFKAYSDPVYHFHPIPLLDLLKVSSELAAVLNYMHHEADLNSVIIYRDLNPSNVGFTSDGKLKLFNFCQARQIRKDSQGLRSFAMQQRSKSMNTARYMAPELFMCLGYSESADVYSWAHVMFELFTLELPYGDQNIHEFTTRVIHNGERPKITVRMPAALRVLIYRCWDTHTSSRPSFRAITGFIECITREAANEGGCAAGVGFYPPPDPELLYSKTINSMLSQALGSDTTSPTSTNQVNSVVESGYIVKNDQSQNKIMSGLRRIILNRLVRKMSSQEM